MIDPFSYRLLTLGLGHKFSRRAIPAMVEYYFGGKNTDQVTGFEGASLLEKMFPGESTTYAVRDRYHILKYIEGIMWKLFVVIQCT